MVAIWPMRHQLAEQLVGLDADGLGEAADGDRRLDLGAALAGGRDRDALAALVAAAAAAADPAGLVFLVEQGGGGHAAR